MIKFLYRRTVEISLSTIFNLKPAKVATEQGNSVLFETDKGVRYIGNVTHEEIC